MKKLATYAAAAMVLAGGSAHAARALQGVVNINTATSAELDLLPGVGESTAARVIEYRQKQTYRKPEDLMKVKGIGPGIFKRVKPYLVVAGPTTLAVAGPTKAGGAGASEAKAKEPGPRTAAAATAAGR